MATYYLCTALPGTQATAVVPGKLLSDQDPSYAIAQSVGALLWPSSDPYVAAAAVLASKFHATRGDPAALQAVMLGGVAQSLRTAATPAPSVALAPAASVVIDWSMGSVFTLTMSTNTALSFANAQDGQTVILIVTNPASYALTWPTASWPNGAVPVQTTSGTDAYTLVNVGSVVYGVASQNMISEA